MIGGVVDPLLRMPHGERVGALFAIEEDERAAKVAVVGFGLGSALEGFDCFADGGGVGLHGVVDAVEEEGEISGIRLCEQSDLRPVACVGGIVGEQRQFAEAKIASFRVVELRDDKTEGAAEKVDAARIWIAFLGEHE